MGPVPIGALLPDEELALVSALVRARAVRIVGGHALGTLGALSPTCGAGSAVAVDRLQNCETSQTIVVGDVRPGGPTSQRAPEGTSSSGVARVPGLGSVDATGTPVRSSQVKEADAGPPGAWEI